MNGTVLITGIGGAQQSAIAAAYRAKGWTVRGTRRQPQNTSRDEESFVADLETGKGLERAVDGVDTVALTLPQDHREGVMERIARSVAKAADQACVERLVLNTAGMIYEDVETPLFEDMKAARQIVHEARALSVVLQPTVFMDNLLAPWSLPAIVNDGVFAYPAPEPAAISWISHMSLADFMVAATMAEGLAGKSLPIGGPVAMRGPEMAQALGRHLGRPITYQRVPLDAFAAGIDAALGPPAGKRIASIYAHLDDEPAALALDGSVATVLDIVPESFEHFVARQSWKAAVKAAADH